MTTEAKPRTALYRFYGTDDQLLYVGISDQLGARWEAHMRLKPWWPEVRRQTSDWYDDRDVAAAAEVAAIVKERPLHNVRHSTRVPRALVYASAWTCPACEWTTTDPAGQISHMEHEAKSLAQQHTNEDVERLVREVTAARGRLEKVERSLARARAAFDQLAGKELIMRPAMSTVEADKLLGDLREALAEDRIRLADLPALLRQLDPDWPPYRKLKGKQIGEVLLARGIRVTNTGNVPRLDPADLRRAAS